MALSAIAAQGIARHELPARSGPVEVVVKDLNVVTGSRQLVAGVTTQFPKSSITAIVGPTGCGKTTLLRAINRMHDHSPSVSVTGRVCVGDIDVYAQETDVRELRRTVGMVFQRPNPFPRSIRENITTAPRAHGLVSRRDAHTLAEQKLTEVGLWNAVRDRLDASPFNLSGGQQQLLCIARTLALDPHVLLLDEPTSALDPGTTELIEGTIKRLSERMTILLVTHNLAQARRLADRVVFLMEGALVEAATARQFFEEPQDARARAYVNGRIG